LQILCVQGVGRRYSHIVCRKANIDLTKRAGELSEEEVRMLLGCLLKTVAVWWTQTASGY